jgi:hypothetical protein
LTGERVIELDFLLPPAPAKVDPFLAATAQKVHQSPLRMTEEAAQFANPLNFLFQLHERLLHLLEFRLGRSEILQELLKIDTFLELAKGLLFLFEIREERLQLRQEGIGLIEVKDFEGRGHLFS